MWVGSYRVPIATLTGSFQHDMIFIDKILGADEIALNDHRSSWPTKLDILWQILNETTISIRHMYPTHMTIRGEALIEEAKKWILAGGTCDFTADLEQLNETATVVTLTNFRDEKLPLQHITVSSDAYG